MSASRRTSVDPPSTGHGVYSSSWRLTPSCDDSRYSSPGNVWRRLSLHTWCPLNVFCSWPSRDGSTPSYSEVAGRTPLPLSPLTAQPSSGYVAAMPRVPTSPPYFPANRMPPLTVPCATIAAFEVTSPGFVDVANGMNDVATPPMNGNTWPRITTANGRVRRSPSPPQPSDVPRSSHGKRARSPSPGRRTVSPLRPASYVSDHRLEN